jgi:hypothetical protein
MLRSLRAAALDAAAVGCGPGALSVKSLSICLDLFTQDVAGAVADSLSGLTSLKLLDNRSRAQRMSADQLAASLAALCRVPLSGGAAGCGSRLTRIKFCDRLKVLTPSLGDALAAMPQLAELGLRGVEALEACSATAEQLARLTQLRRLELGLCTGEGLGPVLSALSSLAELSFEAAGPRSAAAERAECSLRHPGPAPAT